MSKIKLDSKIYLNSREVSERLNYSASYVASLARWGIIPSVNTGTKTNGRYFFHIDIIQAIIAERIKDSERYYTTRDAGKIINVSPCYISMLIGSGQIPPEVLAFKRDKWFIEKYFIDKWKFDMDNSFTVKEIAQQRGVSVQWIETLINQGRLKIIQTTRFKRKNIINVSDVG